MHLFRQTVFASRDLCAGLLIARILTRKAAACPLFEMDLMKKSGFQRKGWDHRLKL